MSRSCGQGANLRVAIGKLGHGGGVGLHKRLVRFGAILFSSGALALLLASCSARQKTASPSEPSPVTPKTQVTASATSAVESVPAAYAGLAASLSQALDSAMTIAGNQHGAKQAFGAELLVANGNRGTYLLAPGTLAGVKLELDRLQWLGLGGVTVEIPSPFMAADYPHSNEYVGFYEQVATMVRAHGMRLIVEVGPLFDNTAFSTVQGPKTTLSLDAFEQQRASSAKRIITEIRPDYLDIGSEPDTETSLQGIKGIDSPDGWAQAVNTILGLIGDRQGVKVGAGAGSWSPLAFHQALVSQTSVDYLSAHIYQLTDAFMQTSMAALAIARSAGKEALIDEAWLTKDAVWVPGTGTMSAYTEIVKRDVFSFWAPYDQRFLALLDRLAGAGYSYVSPFWSTYFFGYLPYQSGMQTQPYAAIVAGENAQASNNIQNGVFGSTGLAYRAIIATAR